MSPAKKDIESTILVTGGAGYIGSHTCKILAQNGFTPVTYDNLSTGHKEAVKWGPFEKGDLGDPSRLNEVLKRYLPKAVIHFAATALVGESVENPSKYYRNNVYGTLNLLECMLEHNIKHIVFSSSCSVYGIPNEIPVPEIHSLNPISPYGRSKLMCEYLLDDFSKTFDINYIALRYFNAAGADTETEIGEDHNPETHLIPLILDTASGKRPVVSIYGDDYSTPDGTCIRDYIHVTDLADAHMKSIHYLESINQSQSINLGTGSGYSVREIIETARKITNKQINEEVIKRRQGDPEKLIAQTDTAKKLLNWTAKQSDIENIIKTAWEWHIR